MSYNRTPGLRAAAIGTHNVKRSVLQARAATSADIKAFYPEMTSSFRAWVCEVDGEVQGIIGLALIRPATGLFSSFREPLRPHLKSLTVLRLIKRVEAAMKASRAPVLAVAEPGVDTAPAILKRLGLEYAGKVGDDTIYSWVPGEA